MYSCFLFLKYRKGYESVLIFLGLGSFGKAKKNPLDKMEYTFCRPKDQGGLGIEVLELKNKCLVKKWVFTLQNEEEI
jgi:hypothetical protein